MQCRLLHFESLFPSLPIRLHPHHRGRVRHAYLVRYGKGRQALVHHRTHHGLAHLRRPGSSPASSFDVLVPRFARLAFCLHLSTPSLLLAQQSARQVLGDYAIIPSRNRWFAAQRWQLHDHLHRRSAGESRQWWRNRLPIPNSHRQRAHHRQTRN